MNELRFFHRIPNDRIFSISHSLGGKFHERYMLYFENLYTGKWKNYEDIEKIGFPIETLDLLLYYGIVEFGANGVSYPKDARSYYFEQFPNLAKTGPLSFWCERSVHESLVWTGVPLESPRELKGSTSAGCVKVISNLALSNFPVVGLIPGNEPSEASKACMAQLCEYVLINQSTPGLIGGDHRVTWLYLKSLREKFSSIQIIHFKFDARRDLYNFPLGLEYNINPANLNLELLKTGTVRNLVLYGRGTIDHP